MQFYQDISEEEEAALPLPENWIRTISLTAGNNATSSGILYKNIKLGLESEEHPLIYQAMAVVSSKSLPPGWVTKDVVLADNSTDRFFYNEDLNLSMWDPPLLRATIAEMLQKHGYGPVAVGITPSKNMHPPSSNGSGTKSSHFDDIISNGDYPISEDRLLEMELQNEFYDMKEHIGQTSGSSDGGDGTNGTKDVSNIQQMDNSVYEYRYPLPEEPLSIDISEHYNNSYADQRYNFPSPHSINTGISSNQRNWEEIRPIIAELTAEQAQRIRKTHPPVSTSGLVVLKEDVIDANDRIHQLLMKLRESLAKKTGKECSFLFYNNPFNAEGRDDQSLDDRMEKDVITLASDIVTSLRQQPQNLILAMSSTNNTNSPAMIQIAFIALHRLLHPYSTDSSMTTALILQAINFQLDEMSGVETLTDGLNPSLVFSRGLLIHDPSTVLNWDPVVLPIPVVPVVPSETVLSCLLRMYAIRRDVTCYYRTIWKPVLPAIIFLISSENISSHPHSFSNLLSVASRLIDNTLNEKSVSAFPATATAVCRVLYEIGGSDTMHYYLLNYLIIPNLLKIFAGDHESMECEELYRKDNVQSLVNRYFDYTYWLDSAGFSNEKDSSYDPIKSLVWIIWRVYSASVFMTEPDIETLTAANFTQGKFSPMDLNGAANIKIRNLLWRVRRKISNSSEFLLQLPMDIQGSDYLGIYSGQVSLNDNIGETNHEQTSEDIARLMSKRLSLLRFKPNEMLNLTIVSRYEFEALFTDVGVAMEIHGISSNSPLYQAISEYLTLNSSLDTEQGIREELLQLTFLYSDGSSSFADGYGEVKNSEIDIQFRYDQLMRGLTLLNRYESALLVMLTHCMNKTFPVVQDLIMDSSWYFNPEFGTDFKIEKVKLATKHTHGSASKTKLSNHGLSQPGIVERFPQFPTTSKTVESRRELKDFKSRKSIHDEVFSTYRFGTTSKCVEAGTSIAGPATTAPKLGPPSECGESIASVPDPRMRSKYTKVAINARSNLLAPTEAYLNHSNPYPDTPQQRHDKFMASLRDVKVIPTSKFQENYQKELQSRRLQQLRYVKEAKILDSEPHHSEILGNNSRPTVKPFPMHLRNRIRMDPDECEPLDYSNESRPMDANELATSIIRDYKAIFKPQNLSPTQNTCRSRTISPNRQRPRSPALPQPIPGTHFFAPTQSLLQKLSEEVTVSAQFLKDLEDGAIPETRNYRQTTDFDAPPFRPVATRIYPLSDNFLNDSQERSAVRSRGASPASSRSNSRGRFRDRPVHDNVSRHAQQLISAMANEAPKTDVVVVKKDTVSIKKDIAIVDSSARRKSLAAETTPIKKQEKPSAKRVRTAVKQTRAKRKSSSGNVQTEKSHVEVQTQRRVAKVESESPDEQPVEIEIRPITPENYSQIDDEFADRMKSPSAYAMQFDSNDEIARKFDSRDLSGGVRFATIYHTGDTSEDEDAEIKLLSNKPFAIKPPDMPKSESRAFSPERNIPSMRRKHTIRSASDLKVDFQRGFTVLKVS